jgi:gas vesicle protein
LFIGGIIGATGLIFNSKEGGNHPETDYGTNIMYGAFSGIIVGVIVGVIIGWNTVYQFNP